MLAVRWYLRYGLSYRDVEELLGERAIQVDHVSIYRWVLRFTPLLYRAIDLFGQVIDVLVSQKRDLTTTRRFFTGRSSTAYPPRSKGIYALAPPCATVSARGYRDCGGHIFGLIRQRSSPFAVFGSTQCETDRRGSFCGQVGPFGSMS